MVISDVDLSNKYFVMKIEVNGNVGKNYFLKLFKKTFLVLKHNVLNNDHEKFFPTIVWQNLKTIT
jgi:hypothetical protein